MVVFTELKATVSASCLVLCSCCHVQS